MEFGRTGADARRYIGEKQTAPSASLRAGSRRLSLREFRRA